MGPSDRSFEQDEHPGGIGSRRSVILRTKKPRPWLRSRAGSLRRKEAPKRQPCRPRELEADCLWDGGTLGADKQQAGRIADLDLAVADPDQPVGLHAL